MARSASTAALAARSNPWSKSAWAKTSLHPARASTTSRPSMLTSSTRIVLTITAARTPYSTTTPRHKRCWIKLKCLTWQVAPRRTRKCSPKRWIAWRTILLDRDSILQPCGSSATALGKVTVLCQLWTPTPSLHTCGIRQHPRHPTCSRVNSSFSNHETGSATRLRTNVMRGLGQSLFCRKKIRRW